MTKVAAAFKKPNPKGAPPTPAATPDNLLRPARGENVPFQVRIPPEARREFKTYAASRDLNLSHLFLRVWEHYKERHS